MHFGLIGKTLSHSFSKTYFEKKFADAGLTEHSYSNFELAEISEFPSLIARENLSGLNVTVPYKESVIRFLSELSPDAKQIGAVNCISFQNGKTIGHNTDAYGFAQSIKPFLDTNHERALVLGTGGASKAVSHALKKVGLEVLFVSSKSGTTANTIGYSDINERVMNAFKLIVNTTPVGTFPDTESFPALPYQFFTPAHLAYDLVYNPAQTVFLKKAAAVGAVTMNGLSMLQLQAEKSWEIWNRKN